MPSTVQASEEFSVAASQSKCWEFFSNLENIGSCIPGCEDVSEIDETTAKFRVKFKVGYLSKTFELKARIRESVPTSHLSFTGEGTDAAISGSLDLRSESEYVVVKYGIEITAVSVTGKTAIAMLGKDLVRKQVTEFATCVKSKLEVS